MQGYDPRQVLLLLGFQAIMLGLIASIAGVLLGDGLSHTIFHHVPAYLSAAFPLGGEQIAAPRTVLLAIGCGVLATMLASLSPAFDLRPGRPADAIFREAGAVASASAAHRRVCRAHRHRVDRARGCIRGARARTSRCSGVWYWRSPRSA